jgi:hypothetical protein
MKSKITGLCLVISIKTYYQAVQNSGDFEEIRDATVTDPDDSAGRLFHAGPRLDGQIDGRQSAPVEARLFQEIRQAGGEAGKRMGLPSGSPFNNISDAIR